MVATAFTVKEQDIFCDLDFSEKNSDTDDTHGNPTQQKEKMKKEKIRKRAEEEQIEMMGNLAGLYWNASEQNPRDRWKAASYRERINSYQKRINKLNNIKLETKLETPGSKKLRTKVFFDVFYYFNWTRLQLIFLDMTSSLPRFNKGFLPKYFSGLGLGYGLRLIVDSIIILVSTFRQEEKDEKPSRWQRFKNVVTKDNRPSRMFNDSVWLAINLSVFIITFHLAPPLALLLCLNAGGFTFDLANFFITSKLDLRPYEHLREKLDKKINEETNPEKRETFQYEKAQLEKKIKEIKKENIQTLIAIALITTGVILSFFPVTAPYGIALLWISTFIFLGMTAKKHHILEKIKLLFSKNPVVEEQVVGNEVQTSLANNNQLVGAPAAIAAPVAAPVITPKAFLQQASSQTPTPPTPAKIVAPPRRTNTESIIRVLNTNQSAANHINKSPTVSQNKPVPVLRGNLPRKYNLNYPFPSCSEQQRRYSAPAVFIEAQGLPMGLPMVKT